MEGTSQVLKLQLVGTGSPYSQTLFITQTGYAGSFTGSSSDCSSIASYTISGSNLTVTGIATGSCTMTVADSFGQTATLPISVTASSVVVQ